jgi:excisionase family DNA binding protein
MNTQNEIHSKQAVVADANATLELRLLNAKQAAEALNISQRQVYDEVREGRLSTVRVGTRVLFRPSDLYNFVESRAVGAKR